MPLLSGLLSLLPVLCVPFLLVLFRATSIWPALITYHVLCWGIPLLQGATVASAGFVSGEPQRWFRRTLFLSMLLVIAGELAHYLVLTHRIDPWWDPIHTLARPWTVYVVYALAVNPVTEEFYWRGFLLQRMNLVRNAWLFWLMHAAALMVFIEPVKALWVSAPTFAFGLLCAWMRNQYGTLWPCVLLHFAADAAILRAIT